jgi:3-deoxy-7-phosphoheptulonate synthase
MDEPRMSRGLRLPAGAGADGVHVEVHGCPEKALRNGQQAMLPHQYVEIVKKMRDVAKLFGKTTPVAG